MEKYFKVGQKVWNIYGIEGVVMAIDTGSQYPLNISFYDRVSLATFTHDGRDNIKLPIVLFQTEPIITPNVPIIAFEEDELVLVRNQGQWYIAFYSHQDEKGFSYCYEYQKRSTEASGIACWEQIRKFNDNPLLCV